MYLFINNVKQKVHNIKKLNKIHIKLNIKYIDKRHKI